MEKNSENINLDPSDKVLVAPAGNFRIYLGVAPGVGKTYAMLSEGKRRLERGTDVVVGLVECHNRPKTEALLNGFEIIPRIPVEYRGKTFYEMDLDAILRRKPQVVLIDELAHTNIPGLKHKKRYEDVLEVLDNKISVISTVNIQHLESIADAVEAITNVPIKERVPDWVVRKADQIELVDSSPEQLRRRMLHGNIYPPEQIESALNNFFKTENLIALRELALRFVADETEEELLEALKKHEVQRVWETKERFLVGVTASPSSEHLLRRAARLAARYKASLHALHIIGSEVRVKDKEKIEMLKELSLTLGATWHEIESDDLAKAMINFARENQITQIILGSTMRSRWQQIIHGSFLAKILKEAARYGISVTMLPSTELNSGNVK